MKKNIFSLLFLLLCINLFANINYCEADKVVYKPGDVAEFTVNITVEQDEDVTVTTYIFSDIYNWEKVSEENITLYNKNKVPNNIVKSHWTVPEDAEWGYAALVSISTTQTNGNAYIYFAVGKEKIYKYGYWGMICNRGMYSKEECIVNVKEGFKQGHYSAMEFFSWQPSCWDAMAPEENEWLSGQTGYIEKKDHMKAMIDAAHESGMNVFSYHQACSWGQGGEEYLRCHPQWWNYDKHGKPFADLNVYDMSLLDNTYEFNTDRKNWKDSGVHPQWIWWSTGNLVFEGMVDFFFNELKKSKEMFDWDGFRSDGFVRNEDTYDAEGNVIKKDSDYPDYSSWVRYIRKRMKEELGEETTFHFNSGSVAYPLEKTSPEVIMTNGEDNSFVLWEGATYAYNKGFDLNDMRNFAEYGHKEVEITRKVGGDRYVMMGLGTNEYIQAIVTAFGGRVTGIVGLPCDPPQRYYPAPYLDFAFRFGEFFWNNKLVHVENEKSFISVDKNVYWDTLVQKLEKNGKTYYMVHLINAPESYSVSDPIPAPVENVTVKIDVEGTVKSYAISPDFGPDNSFAYAQGDSILLIPGVKQWTVAVFEVAQ
ncbi:MAG: hypothetical protein IJS60_04560 [Abditibacteriota bacterium]|nr:hypothetical protein [Abditibacteriota bacterium]